MASATSVALRSSTRLLQAGSALRSRFVPRQCISIARSFCVDAAQSGQSTSSTATAPDTPTLWQLKSPAALEPLTSPETLKGHEKGLLLEKEDLFCRRMARTWEVVANAVWTKGSKAEQLLEEACGQQLFDRFVALRKAKTGYKSRMTVKSSELVDYLEFVNVADSKGSVGKCLGESSPALHESQLISSQLFSAAWLRPCHACNGHIRFRALCFCSSCWRVHERTDGLWQHPNARSFCERHSRLCASKVSRVCVCLIEVNLI